MRRVSGDGGHDAWLSVVGLKRTRDQKLSSSLMLLTFMSVSSLWCERCLRPGTCYNDIGVNSCTCSSGCESVEEAGKLICRIGVYSVAPK